MKNKMIKPENAINFMYNENEILEREQRIIFAYYKIIDVYSKFFEIILNISTNSYLIPNDVKSYLSIVMHETKILSKGFPKNLENEFNPDKMADSIFLSQETDMTADDFWNYSSISRKKLSELYGKYLNSDTNFFIKIFKNCKVTNLFCSYSMLNEFFRANEDNNQRAIKEFSKLIMQSHQIIKTELYRFLNNSSKLFRMINKKEPSEILEKSISAAQINNSYYSTQLPKLPKTSKPFTNLGVNNYILENKYRIAEKSNRKFTKKIPRKPNIDQSSFLSNTHTKASLTSYKSFDGLSFLANSIISDVKLIETKLRDIKTIENKAKKTRKHNSVDFDGEKNFIWNRVGLRRQSTSGSIVSPKSSSSINFFVNKKKARD